MTFDFTRYRDELLFVPLGGSNEIGMNLNLYTYQGKWLMVDCGIGFAHEHLPGIEIMVPDADFIAQRKKDLLGLVLTHAHEDHVGAIPYLWREFECPIYATPFTAAFVRHKMSEMGPGKKPVVHEVKPRTAFELGPFKLEMVHLTHSIPEMQALAITTPKGVVMHTGDWKFDAEPLIGEASDYEALTRYGDEGILAMVCDSTNVFVEGESGSEADVRRELTAMIKACPQRAVVTTFASNVARVETVILAAREAGRVIALAGRSLSRIVDAAHESGYLKEAYEFVSEREIMNVPREDLVILCTGCQGEPRAALTRIARGDHQSIRLSPGDRVIFSSRRIPGNETRIGYVMNKLAERGIEVVTDRDAHIHVSGHPAREELKRMYRMVRPRIAVPTHGETRHLQEHARLARSLGVSETVQASNGAVVWLSAGDAAVIGRVRAGYVAVDGASLIPSDGEVIRARRRLRDEGAVFVSAAVDASGRLKAEPSFCAPGLLDARLDGELFEECLAEIRDAVDRAKPRSSDEQIKELVRLALRKTLRRELDKKPHIEVHVLRAG